MYLGCQNLSDHDSYVRYPVNNFWDRVKAQSSVSDFIGLYKHKHKCQHQPLKLSINNLALKQASDTSTEEAESLYIQGQLRLRSKTPP